MNIPIHLNGALMSPDYKLSLVECVPVLLSKSRGQIFHASFLEALFYKNEGIKYT